MNEEEYNKIMKEVKKGKLTEKYEIKKGTLHRRKNDKLLKVIRRYEWEAVMYMMHDHPTSAHFGVKATYGHFAIEKEETLKNSLIYFIC